MEIFQRRGKWRVRTPEGKLYKFNDEATARFYAALELGDYQDLIAPEPVFTEEIDDGKEETEDFETESSEEETSTDKQKTVRIGESVSEEEVQSVPFSLRKRVPGKGV